MSISEQTAFLDATDQAALVSKGDVSADELLDASIEGAEKVNPDLNFIVTRMYDQAKAAIKAGLPDGPFTGVPFLLKDLGPQYAGVPTAGGSKLLADILPEVDSVLVQRYKRAGLVIFAKTLTPEFGFQPTTEPELHGRCKNPWDTTRNTGGSSGGSGAAVAAGVASMGHGNDGGGSIRVPASALRTLRIKTDTCANFASAYAGR
jgi:amidase